MVRTSLLPGWSPLWQFFAAFIADQETVVVGGIALLLGYCWAAIKRTPRPVSREVVRFHRREQMARLRAILWRALRFKKIDNFGVEPRSLRGPSFAQANLSIADLIGDF